MQRWKISPGRGRHCFIRVLLLSLVLAGFVPGGIDVGTVVLEENCGSDILHPFSLEVVPLGAIRPGAPVTARIDFESRVALDNVSVRIKAPRDLVVTATGASVWGRVRAAESRHEEFTVMVSPKGPRQTVEVTVEGTLDGSLLRRSAVLNLVTSPEPSRLVTTADGRTIREVPARKLP